jgi:starch synthase (maltosyl-transferring)
MIIYNLFPLLAGKFSQWKPHIERAAEMGFDWIFVNPIQKPGMSGSLYSILDYYQLNPKLLDPDSSLSADDQLREVARIAQDHGISLMVDLVINHCAVDSKLAQEHRNWFVQEPDGSIAHPFCMEDGRKVVWGDLIRFDHLRSADREGLYRYCLGVVEYLIKLGFKGFRCDAAYQIPRDIWRRLINDVKSRYPDTVFAAETLGCTAEQTKQTAQAGFDYVFNSSKWWDFQSSWLLEQYQLIREIAPSISFPESHDTQRLCQEMNGNVEALKQRYLFASFFSAGSMMPIGYEFGFRKKLHVVHTTPQDWEQTGIDLRDFITKANAVKKEYKVFQEECPTTILPHSNPNILLLWKASVKTPEEALIILNKDPWNRQHFYTDNLQGYVQAGAPLVDVSPEYPLDYIPTRPFSYELRPGQGFVMVTMRDAPANTNSNPLKHGLRQLNP